MSIIRTDEQADALEILKLIIETADFYRAMGEILTEENVDHPLFDIAKQREAYIEPLKKIVTELGEFPTTPDPDKELLEQLGGMVTKLLSADLKGAVFDKCLEKDDVLAELIDKTNLGKQSTDFKQLLDSLSAHIASTKKRLSKK